MRHWRKIAGWVLFVGSAICVQALAPGLDVLVVGIIICLQERDYRSLIWLLPLCILLQEGMGTRPFGAALIWYATVVALFNLGRWLFQAENFFFMFMLSGCLGCAYFSLAWLMAPLQDLAFSVEDTLDKALVQAIFLPFAWFLVRAFRRPWKSREEQG